MITLFFTSSTFAQEYMGIKVGGFKTEVIKKFEDKGFSVVDSLLEYNKDWIMMAGNYDGKHQMVRIYFSPTSNTVFRFVIFFLPKTTWVDLITEYNEYLVEFTKKYGPPALSVGNVSRPYADVSLEEMEKIGWNYYSFWDPPYEMSVQMTKEKQVRLEYQNSKNFEKTKKERLRRSKKKLLDLTKNNN